MADKKPAGKPPAKPSGGGGSSAEGQMIFMAVIAIVVVFIILPTVFMFFGYTGKYTAVTNNFTEKVSYAFSTFVDTVGFISIFISLLFVMGLIYAKTRHKEITEAYSAHLKAVADIGKPQPLKSNLVQLPGIDTSNAPVAPTPVSNALPALNPFEQYMQASGQPIVTAKNSQTQSAPVQPVSNPRWTQIEKNMQSHNMSEWRIAILEADILLYDMLSQMGYEGTSIGEILKNVDKANFVTLDDAWKAHRVRNIIAHEGANYELSRDEAERTIRLYKRVFDEFYFV